MPSRSALLVLALSALVACKKGDATKADSGAATLDAGITEADVKRVLKQARPAMEKCYVDALAKKPDQEGKVVLVFSITREGRVDPKNAGMGGGAGNPEFARCVLDVLVKLAFPKPAIVTDIEIPLDLGKYVDAGVAPAASASVVPSPSAAPSAAPKP